MTVKPPERRRADTAEIRRSGSPPDPHDVIEGYRRDVADWLRHAGVVDTPGRTGRAAIRTTEERPR